MAINVTDLRHLEKFKVLATAHWAFVDVNPSNDPKARAFCAPGAELKPVLYMPVKRRGGSDTIPKLRIQVQLLEEFKKSLNFKVPQLAGAEVKVEVSNQWNPFGMSQHMTLPSGKLTADLGCDIDIDAATVKKFLDPNGPMQARLNENLLSFLVEIPAIPVDGSPLQGASQNYVYLYRKKSIVFLPGVFGSQFEVATDTGKSDAFPNLLGRGMLTVGILECDQTGEPLLPAFDGKAKLLRLKGQVYDTFTKLHEGRVRRMPIVPEDFLVLDLRLFAYDWRGDLTEQTNKMMKRLEDLQKELQALPDTDDQVAISGHSTGGVIIRRMLAESSAASMISHVFFMNVPFRGAPKALSVFLTGNDPPGGDPMLPIVGANSLRNIACCAPIVYHLAPSYKYPDAVSEVQGTAPSGGREGEKKGLIDAALERGMYFMRYAPVTVPASLSDRAVMAAGADKWGSFIDDAAIHHTGRAAYQRLGPGPAAVKFTNWQDDQITDRGLGTQKSQRSAIGWNDTLARKAEQFHRDSEAAAASGAWADKAFIFYSKGHQTTTRVLIQSEGTTDCRNEIVALIKPSNTTGDLFDGVAHPPNPTDSSNERHFEQWVYEAPGTLEKRFWKLGAKREDGDGTVPLRSLLGFGGAAKVFKALPGSPEHVPAPNSDWMWDRVLEVLQGIDVQAHLINANTQEGKE